MKGFTHTIGVQNLIWSN